MRISLDSFTIEYDKEISYIPDIISRLEDITSEILEFFELEKLSQKKKVVIFTDREKYKEHILQFIPEFKEWMCADTYDGNINLLEISEARKSKDHADMDLNEFIKCIVHEFVHLCQQECNHEQDTDGTVWYWEALATNLSGQDYNPVSLDDCDFEQLKNDFNNTEGGYSYSYTIGKYMLENYSKDKLLEYVRNPFLLKKDMNDIFEAAKKSQKIL